MPVPTEQWIDQILPALKNLDEDQWNTACAIMSKYDDAAFEAGLESVARLNPKQRQELWQIMFPGIVKETESGWRHLPQEFREGEGRFVWTPPGLSHNKTRLDWLRHLFPLTSREPHWPLQKWLKDYRDLNQGDPTHRYGGEDYGYRLGLYSLVALTVALITADGGRESAWVARAQEALDANGYRAAVNWVEQDVLTETRQRFGPYDWIEELPKAGLDETQRRKLLPWNDFMPLEPWTHLLQTIQLHRLHRYASVRNWLFWALGSRWNWKAGAGLTHWLSRFVAFHVDPTEREKALDSEVPAEVFLALCACGRVNGHAALERVRLILAGSRPESQLACVEMLRFCPHDVRTPVLVPLISAADARVAGAAIELLDELMDADVATSKEIIDRLEARLQHPWSKTPQVPRPLPKVSLDRDTAIDLLAAAAREGGLEQRAIPWLKQMSPRTREDLVIGLQNCMDQPEKRTLHLGFVRDASWSVAERALSWYQKQQLTGEELVTIENLLTFKQPQRRMKVIDLLLSLPDTQRLESLCRLLASTHELKRQGGEELQRRLQKAIQESPEQPKPAEQDTGAAAPMATPETSALQRQGITLSPAREIPDSSTAFGLVDVSMLPDLPPARDLGVTLVTANTLPALQRMDELVSLHLETPFTVRNWKGETEERTISRNGVPYSPQTTDTDVRAKFPLVPIWEEWWLNRPEEERDADDLDLIRMNIMLIVHETLKDTNKHSEAVRKASAVLIGSDAMPDFVNGRHLAEIRRWLQILHPPEKGRKFAYDAYETAEARIRHLAWTTDYGIRLPLSLSSLTSPLHPYTDEERVRLWNLANGVRGRFSRSYWYDVIWAMQTGHLSHDELRWFLLHKPRDTFEWRHIEKAADASDSWQAVVDECRTRLIEVELLRGEAPQDSTKFVGRSPRLRASDLAMILHAQGARALAQYDRDDMSRDVVLSRCIQVSAPHPRVTQECFSQAMRLRHISRERLIELGVVAPKWARLVEGELGIAGYESLSYWLHAHSKLSDNDLRAAGGITEWKAQMASWTSIPADDLLDGAVDVDWFLNSRSSMPDDVWEQMHVAAKFICRGNGHTRARLLADAMSGNLKTADLIRRIEKDRHQDSVRALGLVPLPAAAKARAADLLHRYQVLGAFMSAASQAKAQRRSSEENSARIGLENLARAAGHEDVEEFRWTMEMETASVLRKAFAPVTVGAVTVSVEISAAGKIGLKAAKGDSELKSLPAALKKHPQVTALGNLCAAARQQVSRTRNALEQMMIRQQTLASATWQKMARHPLVAPLLCRMILGDDAGPGGWPQPDGSGLGRPEGSIAPWPKAQHMLRLSHTLDFLPADRWAEWQEAVVNSQLVQPVKQVFREVFVLLQDETSERAVSRYKGLSVYARQAAAVLGTRGWVLDDESCLCRFFHQEKLRARLSFDEAFINPGDLEHLTVNDIVFCRAKHDNQHLPLTEIPSIVFSEAVRDVDFALATAHCPGSNPRHERSLISLKAQLVKFCAKVWQLPDLSILGDRITIRINDKEYSVNLANNEVWCGGQALPLRGLPAPEEVYLPFADQDPQTAELLSIIQHLSQGAA
ncbi:MAG: DUF5724 domain-containing protein [Verrucomicrobiales bacterium]|nr:DUF4132 domain-containing protein [Verrucomicrobiae bacterium]MCP5552633.1 DUF4132 domain-containing protein [Akkermansiaceae bacterium]